MSNEINKIDETQKDETIQLNSKFIDKDHKDIVINENHEKNNNLIIDLMIKTNKISQGLSTMLDLVNDPKSKNSINESMIMSSESYSKVQDSIIMCISTINKEILPKFELLQKEAKNGTN